LQLYRGLPEPVVSTKDPARAFHLSVFPAWKSQVVALSRLVKVFEMSNTADYPQHGPTAQHRFDSFIFDTVFRRLAELC
jgi:hypothetical protein